MSKRSVATALEKLDFHPKLAKEYAVRTKSGAAVSIFAIFIAILLFFSQYRIYKTTDTVEIMSVDLVRDEIMRINFDVTFPKLPCAFVSVDTIDALGTENNEILHNIFKKRLGSNGRPLSGGKKEDLNAIGSSKELESKRKEQEIRLGRAANTPASGTAPACGSCYGAGEPGMCCNTCEQVRDAHKKKGWKFDTSKVEQCIKEGIYVDIFEEVASKEGCNIYGFLEVPKVPGSFHISPAFGVYTAGDQSSLKKFFSESYNASHVVNSLSFGPYHPELHYPLDNRAVNLDVGYGMHQYYIKLIPTVYKPLGKDSLSTYQFSATEHFRRISHDSVSMQQMLFPGVYFNYEFSPIQVTKEERSKSFFHFLTTLCAIVGGVFSVMGLVDALVYRVSESATKGRMQVAANRGSLLY